MSFPLGSVYWYRYSADTHTQTILIQSPTILHTFTYMYSVANSNLWKKNT